MATASLELSELTGIGNEKGRPLFKRPPFLLQPGVVPVRIYREEDCWEGSKVLSTSTT